MISSSAAHRRVTSQRQLSTVYGNVLGMVAKYEGVVVRVVCDPLQHTHTAPLPCARHQRTQPSIHGRAQGGGGEEGGGTQPSIVISVLKNVIKVI